MSLDPISTSSPPPPPQSPSPPPSPSPPSPSQSQSQSPQPQPLPLSVIPNPNPNHHHPHPRKVPPPCWTPDETLALVHAYRDKWFSLRRRNLRSPDWDEVAADVSRRCPASLPPKSSVQCRHKIEKLRKRYRSEKQRSLSFPGRFSSSWDLFPILDDMEIAVVAPPQNPHPFLLRKHTSPAPAQDLDDDDDRNLVTTAFGSTSAPGLYGVQVAAVGGHGHGHGHASVPVGVRMRRNGNYGNGSNVPFGVDNNVGGFPVKSLGNRNLMPASGGVRARSYGDRGFDAKLNNHYDHHHHSDDYGSNHDKDVGFYPRMSGDRLVPSGIRSSMNPNRFDGSSTSNVDSGAPQSGSPSGVKRKADPIAEMVSSIKMLGKGFVQMEKKKMEMAREIEKMRMDAEMKRNEMMIKSQQQIVDVFIGALYGKKKKVKMEEPSHS